MIMRVMMWFDSWNWEHKSCIDSGVVERVEAGEQGRVGELKDSFSYVID